MWRYDAGRTASSPRDLPDELHLLWVRQYSPREPVWDDPLNHDLMRYDRVFEPVVMGKIMFVGFNDSDKIVALRTDTGEELWTFRTDGPVRMAPAAWNGRVYFTSDDGYLYCLDAGDGSLVWKFRGGPSDRKILGNKRLISMWPARGGAVVHEGVVYFAASIWPFMGTFIYALDAETGEVVWVNDGNGSEFMLQPHNTPSFAGVAPQGAFVVAGDRLLVPGGRSVPAVFDRRTGEFLYYRLASRACGKTGGAFVCARGDVFFNHHREKVTNMYHLRSGNALVAEMGEYPVLSEDAWYFSGETVTAYRAGWVSPDLGRRVPEGDAAAEKELMREASGKCRENLLWKFPVDATGDLIRAGRRLYAAGDGVITAVEIPARLYAAGGGDGGGAVKPKIAWTKAIEGRIERLVAADDKLFAVTLDGRIMAFGGERRRPRRILERPVTAEPSPEAEERARSILAATGVREGYALFYGVGDGALLEAVLANSRLHVVAVDRDAEKVRELRRRFDANGLYGRRISVHGGDPLTFPAPPYFASLTVVKGGGFSGGKRGAALIEKIFRSMRPYGGTAYLPLVGKSAETFIRAVAGSGVRGAVTETGDGYVLLKREGPLPGAGTWTHNYGNIANTAKSDDELVKLPLGILWFGGNSNLDVLPRHGHGPPEQVVGGRLFIEGMNCLSARDVYTGRVLWKTVLYDLDNFGVYYDRSYRDAPTDTRYNQVHLPGANARGTNFVATADRVYVVQKNTCRVLDSVTGKTLGTFRFPPVDSTASKPVYPEWGYIGVYGDMLIGGRDFVAFSDFLPRRKAEYSVWEDFDATASKALVVMDRYSGEVKWEIEARHGFLHNGIAAGNGRLYCLDKPPPYIERQLERRGKKLPGGGRLLCLDMETGETVWQDTLRVFGSFLCYSREHDVLVQSTRPSRDMLRGEEGKRMAAYRGGDGTVLWDRQVEYRTFPVLHGAKIVTESGVFSLLSGEPVPRRHPLTGKEIPWRWKRNYGCNYPIASEYLLTFRSGAAGFYDFANACGTGNFGGFKSGCTNNMVAADGLLNIPDYTRTCSCPYQNQTSLALVHMPGGDVEIWTFDPMEWNGDPVRRVGINFGAPGLSQRRRGIPRYSGLDGTGGTLVVPPPLVADRGRGPQVGGRLGRGGIRHRENPPLGRTDGWRFLYREAVFRGDGRSGER